MAPAVCLLVGEVAMNRNKRTVFWLILGLMIIVCLVYWFGVDESQPPERDFSTSQLLIPALPGWGIYDGPGDRPAHDFYLTRAVGGSVIRFLKPPEGIEQWSPADVNNGLWEPVADMTQWVVKFSTVGDARRAYKEHYWIPDDTQNPFKISPWQPLGGVEYKSQTADQFRIVCDTRLQQQGFTSCHLEAQYEEFYILIQYGTFSFVDAISDLNAIAAAADAQMERFLDSKK